MPVHQQLGLSEPVDTEHTLGEKSSVTDTGRPSCQQSRSDPTSTRSKCRDDDVDTCATLDVDLRDNIHESTTPMLSQTPHLHVPNPRHSSSTYPDSPSASRPDSPTSSLPSLLSSTTSAEVSVNILADPKTVKKSKRSSILTLLKSSVSTSTASPRGDRRSDIRPSDFQIPPEQPEKQFIDSIGMVIPGVCNRDRCAHPLAHFVTTWRLCEPIEYATALADHGITYTDYCRLLAALAKFLDEIPNEQKVDTERIAPWWHPRRRRAPQDNAHDSKEGDRTRSAGSGPTDTTSESRQYYKIAEQQSSSLNRLLHEISWNWQKRGLPVMVCVGSYSLFAPNRIPESHIQIFHVQSHRSTVLEPVKDPRMTIRSSFMDPSALAKPEGRSVAVPRQELNRRSLSPPSPSSSGGLSHHHQVQLRDRTRPWPLWPNAIPSRKRELMNDHADRYGVDPYFRAWMRANINSRTRSTSYAKYMIEQEDDPFINKRLNYVTPPSRRALLWSLITGGPEKWKQLHPGAENRGKYEHNRRLECRKTVENGSRLRIVRFAFRHPIYPPHTPEMQELGLTREAYQSIVEHIEEIRDEYKVNGKACIPRFLASWLNIRRRSTQDALNRISKCVRHVNAEDRRIVWTIERIPGVYERSLKRDKKEWELSAWNGEDPLELLIQLEKWGIIEQKLDIDDEE